ncbi:MAG: DMT family transporter [Bacteroidetes bacterium]|nr:DMT family transporter [Bacteroidota bacterium]
MYWLLLSIFTNSALLLILKSFTKFRIDTLQGIVVNYFTAGFIGILIGRIPLSAGEIAHQPWAWMPLALGSLFISIFLLLARTAQTMGVSVATVANKMSVAIPVVAAILLYGEAVTFKKITGLALALTAVYLTSLSKEKSGSGNLKRLWMPALVFAGSGIIDALINHSQKMVSEVYNSFFISLCFLTAGIFGILIVGYKVAMKKTKIDYRNIIAGIILGIPNYFSIYGITHALNSHIMESSVLYPVNNMGIVALSAMGALLLFHEKLSLINWAGLILSLCSIALIAF